MTAHYRNAKIKTVDAHFIFWIIIGLLFSKATRINRLDNQIPLKRSDHQSNKFSSPFPKKYPLLSISRHLQIDCNNPRLFWRVTEENATECYHTVQFIHFRRCRPPPDVTCASTQAKVFVNLMIERSQDYHGTSLPVRITKVIQKVSKYLCSSTGGQVLFETFICYNEPALRPSLMHWLDALKAPICHA